jgi:hypothetical protein
MAWFLATGTGETAGETKLGKLLSLLACSWTWQNVFSKKRNLVTKKECFPAVLVLVPFHCHHKKRQ